MASNPRIPFRLSNERARLAPPDGKPLIVHVAVNNEVWPFDQPMPRAILQAPHGRQPNPDIANFSWVEYGLRCGLPRLIEEFGRRGLPVSNIMSASLPDIYPSAAGALMAAGWELVGHSVVQRSLQSEPDEVATIADTMRLLEEHTGRRPRGWLGPGFGETLETPDHLKAAGIDFLFEWMVDDLPCWMRTRHGPMIALPYALDLNDVMVFALEKHPAGEYLARYAATVAVLEPELERQPRVLTIALHPHVIAVPYRFDALRRVLDMLSARSDTVFLTGSAIADWFSGATGGPDGAEAIEAQAVVT